MRKTVEIKIVLVTEEKIADIRREAWEFKNPEEEIIFCGVKTLKIKDPTVWLKGLKKSK
jgi:hypothetical protein